MTLHNIKNVSISILMFAGMILLWSFAARENRQMVCTGYEINIQSGSKDYFINKLQVEQIINKHFDTIQGQHINQEMLQRLHYVIENIDYADHARVYRTIDGKIGIDIHLREPLIRVINQNNESFYIDKNGYMFPLSGQHTARMMLVTGNIPTSFSSGINIRSQHADQDYTNSAILSDVFTLSSYIYNNAFLSAFIDHIYVLPDNKIELIPKNGAHVIEFGYADNIENKFRKMELFYLYGLPGKGWHYYNRINLEYRNQIICSK